MSDRSTRLLIWRGGGWKDELANQAVGRCEPHDNRPWAWLTADCQIDTLTDAEQFNKAGF